MGSCASMGPKIPDIDVLAVLELVFNLLKNTNDDYNRNVEDFKEGMKRSAPGEHVISKEKLGKPTPIQEGKTEEKKVRTYAAIAALGGQFKLQVQEDVWKEMSPKVENEIPADVPAMLRPQVVKGARKACDALVDKILNKILEKVTKKLEEGEGFSIPTKEEIKEAILNKAKEVVAKNKEPAEEKKAADPVAVR